MLNKTLFSLILLALASLLWLLFNSLPAAKFKLSEPPAASASAPLFQADFASHQSTPQVHSATAVELADHNVMVFWYGGIREGDMDVSIYSNIWNHKTGQWGTDREVINRQFTRDSSHRYIRKLGNPVVMRGPDKGLWLFYVSVSVGGWAGSAINLSRSYDEGQTWSPSRRLITSPFFNLSTLIKGTPILYQDGTIGLPVYHEMLNKFAELLRLNKDGKVLYKTRLSWGSYSLQPIIFIHSEDRALVMMRYAGTGLHRILQTRTRDAGLSWSPVSPSSLPNPNAGISGLTLGTKNPKNELLLAFNNSEEERDDLSLARSLDQGNSWQLITTIELKRLNPPDNGKQFSYPWLLQTRNGQIHLFYTWHRNHIKHLLFNQAWLEQELLQRRKK